MTKLLFFAGSACTDPLNKKLASLAASMVKDAGADVTYIDMRDFEMPLYDGDDEAQNGIPANAIKLKKLFVEHDGFFIASPEYNSSMPPLANNTLDWLTRPHEENEPPLVAFNGKVAALGAVSLGGLGGIRGLVQLRMMLGHIGVTVVPTQVAINFGMKAFGDDSQLTDDMQAKFLQGTIDEFIKTTDRLSG